MTTRTETTCSPRAPKQTTPYIDPVLAEVRRQLLASPFAALKELQTDFYEGVIVLRGKVPTFYTRQVAIALVMKIAGVQELDDRLVVDEPTALQ